MLPRVRIKFTLPQSPVFQPSSNDTDTDIELTQEEVAMVSGSQLSSTTTASMDVNVDLPATFQDLSLSSNSNSDGKQSCPPLSSSPPSSCSTNSDPKTPKLSDAILLPACTGSYSANGPGLSLITEALQTPESFPRITTSDLYKKSIQNSDLPPISTRESVKKTPATGTRSKELRAWRC
jgi:hypothetical protein